MMEIEPMSFFREDKVEEGFEGRNPHWRPFHSGCLIALFFVSPSSLLNQLTC